mmetsp:Transcript_5480/g.12143  ORF Transcript_5480/g.12143 Transcript_5480/m.12143 type:complete len:96 (+) Transcript_5480:683-970(+)
MAASVLTQGCAIGDGAVEVTSAMEGHVGGGSTEVGEGAGIGGSREEDRGGRDGYHCHNGGKDREQRGGAHDVDKYVSCGCLSYEFSCFTFNLKKN